MKVEARMVEKVFCFHQRSDSLHLYINVKRAHLFSSCGHGSDSGVLLVVKVLRKLHDTHTVFVNLQTLECNL